MTALRTLKKLILGETWLLPLGIASALAISLFARAFAPPAWTHLGGFLLLAGVLAVLVVSVGRAAPRR